MSGPGTTFPPEEDEFFYDCSDLRDPPKEKSKDAQGGVPNWRFG